MQTYLLAEQILIAGGIALGGTLLLVFTVRMYLGFIDRMLRRNRLTFLALVRADQPSTHRTNASLRRVLGLTEDDFHDLVSDLLNDGLIRETPESLIEQQNSVFYYSLSPKGFAYLELQLNDVNGN